MPERYYIIMTKYHDCVIFAQHVLQDPWRLLMLQVCRPCHPLGSTFLLQVYHAVMSCD